ncbi:MAG: ECF transporter S component [Bacillota bacterium]|nr:ECF transporter S component [Bacillota bacterium]
MKKNTLWITQTGIMLAALLILQFATKSLGQYVTGSCVNFVLVTCTLVCGLSSGIVIALLSPFFALFLGVGPAIFVLTPCISVANVVIVLVSALARKRIEKGEAKQLVNYIIIVFAALAKFCCIYLLIVKLVLPILGLPPEKTALMSAMFSYPQLVTALIGGILSVAISAIIIKAIKKH